MEVENPVDNSETIESGNCGTVTLNGSDSNASKTEIRPELELRLSDENVTEILDCIQKCPATFRSQQIGDPELTETDKRQIAQDLLNKSQINFLAKFGRYLKENHLDYFLSSSNSSYEIEYHVKQLKTLLNNDKLKLIKRNRRFEALKRLESEGKYFSETEMERRDPLLYHQLVGQYLSEKEKADKKLKENMNDNEVIPTFSSFLIQKMEEDQLDDLRKSQQEAEGSIENDDLSSDENSNFSTDESPPEAPRWGEDWIDAEKKKQNKNKRKKKQKKVHLSSNEKSLLMDEFKSIMHTKFLNGVDADFDYSTVDSNPEYDCLQVRSQDEEEKYFDEETCDNEICTDTGIEDY